MMKTMFKKSCAFLLALILMLGSSETLTALAADQAVNSAVIPADATAGKVKVNAGNNRTIYVTPQAFSDSPNEGKIYTFLITKGGLNTAAACAVLGNMFEESLLDPKTYGASENSWGLCQWENQRLDQLQQRYPKNWKTLDGQLSYLMDEFNYSSLDPWGPQTYEYLKKLPNTAAGARDGALYFAKWFERCWSGSYGKRQNWAENFYKDWSKTVSSPIVKSMKAMTEDSITVKWTRPGDAAKTTLQIFDADGTKIKGVTTTAQSYTFNGLKRKKTYTIKMWSLSASGKASKKITQSVTIDNIPNQISASSCTKTSLAVPWVFSLGATALDNANLTYKSNNPSVVVSANGKVSIKAKFVGTAKITITAEKTKKYVETKKTITVKVIPPKPESLKIENLPVNCIQVTWKASRPANGYEIQWSKSSTFASGARSDTVYGTTFSYIIYGAALNSTYYVRVRNYRVVDGKNYYSAWTTAKKVKITK